MGSVVLARTLLRSGTLPSKCTGSRMEGASSGSVRGRRNGLSCDSFTANASRSSGSNASFGTSSISGADSFWDTPAFAGALFISGAAGFEAFFRLRRGFAGERAGWSQSFISVRTALPPEAWALSRGEPALETLEA